MRTLFSICLLLLLLPGSAFAQAGEAPENPVMTSLKGLHDLTASHIMQTAEMLDEEMYDFRPTDDVRTTGQMLAHIASAQYLICSVAAGEENPSQINYEETATTKADIVPALREALDYCGSVYERITDAEGAEIRSLFNMPLAASAILAFNSSHNYEHYGSLVTYMRINGIVPPSSM